MAGPWQIHGTAQSWARGLWYSPDHLNLKSQTTQISHYFLPLVIYFSPVLRALGLLHLFPFVYLFFSHHYKSSYPPEKETPFKFSNRCLFLADGKQNSGAGIILMKRTSPHPLWKSEICPFFKKICLVKVQSGALKYPERGIKSTLVTVSIAFVFPSSN